MVDREHVRFNVLASLPIHAWASRYCLEDASEGYKAFMEWSVKEVLRTDKKRGRNTTIQRSDAAKWGYLLSLQMPSLWPLAVEMSSGVHDVLEHFGPEYFIKALNSCSFFHIKL